MPALRSNGILRAALPLLAIFCLYAFGTGFTGFLVCPFRWATSLPCPFCGMTHALAALVHGQFAEAVAFHPFSPLALAGLLATAAGRTLPPSMWKWLVVGLGVFGGVRMLIAAL